MKDTEGTEIAVGDTIVHALKLSCAVRLSRRKVIVVEQRRVKTEWETDVRLPGKYNTPSGKYDSRFEGLEYIPGPVERRTFRTWVYTPLNVMVLR